MGQKKRDRTTQYMMQAADHRLKLATSELIRRDRENKEAMVKFDDEEEIKQNDAND